MGFSRETRAEGKPLPKPISHSNFITEAQETRKLNSRLQDELMGHNWQELKD